MPEYDVASAFQADENGRFLSRNLGEHSRQRRGNEEPNTCHYNIKAFGTSLHLNLTRNNDFMAPDLEVERHHNGTVTREDAPKNSFLSGHVTSIPGSSVAISNDNGLVSNQ